VKKIIKRGERSEEEKRGRDRKVGRRSQRIKGRGE
jgi:hypothetical protein